MPENEKPSAQASSSQQPGNSNSRVTVVRSASPARRAGRAFGYTLGVVACLVSMVAGALFAHLYWGSDFLQGLIKEHGASMVWNGVVHQDPFADWTPDKQFPNRSSMNVLILGVDHDYDNRDQIIRTTPGRSDSILLARVDFVNKTINALTIPRDAAVRIPGHENYISKINAAHEFGGPELTKETIKQVFGVDTDAYFVVDFEGFQEIVNKIGGIDVNVMKKLDYDDNWGHLHIHLKPGYQHLDGYRAMGYVRMRHSDSDEMRSKRQHEFLEAMRNKIKEPSTFKVLPELIDTLNKDIKHDITRDQMLALANFARSIRKEDINVETLPSFEGPSFVTIDNQKSAEVIQRLFFPNQQVALNIDAPDPNHVRDLNAPYERPRRHRTRQHHSRKHHTAPSTPNGDTGAGSAPPDKIDSAPPDSAPGDTSGTG